MAGCDGCDPPHPWVTFADSCLHASVKPVVGESAGCAFTVATSSVGMSATGSLSLITSVRSVSHAPASVIRDPASSVSGTRLFNSGRESEDESVWGGDVPGCATASSAVMAAATVSLVVRAAAFSSSETEAGAAGFAVVAVAVGVEVRVVTVHVSGLVS